MSRKLREEAALRRVAMLVASEVAESAVFEAVISEASQLLAPSKVEIVRVENPAQVDETVSRVVHEAGAQCAASVPIVVGSVTWGVLVAVSSTPGTLDTEQMGRFRDFSSLVARAIASARARDEMRDLAESQGALRRIATLVAQGADPQTVCTAVAVETARILGLGAVSLISYDASTGTFTKVFGTHGERAAVPDGGQWELADCPEGALILETGGPVRIDDWGTLPGPVAAKHRAHGWGQAVAAPIMVDGLIWGHIAAFSEAGVTLEDGCEARLADFTQLVASAISNAQMRDELRGLAERQGAALRRVATLVAQRASLNTIFDAVAREASQALGVPRVDVGRCHEDGSVSLLGATGRPNFPRDRSLSVCEEYIAARVIESTGVTRIDNWATLPPMYADEASQDELRSVICAPILVEDVLWGVIIVLADELLQDDAETRLTDFTHLVASSISIVHARNRLIASRARIVTASDETRRRIERNLHDGIQQRLVALGLALRNVRAKSGQLPDVQAGLDEIDNDLEIVLDEIRVFSQGLHPTLLSRSGLGASLRALARRSPIPVSLDVEDGRRFPEATEAAIYYVVSESLANATKHSRASEVTVKVRVDAEVVRATVADDGVGGAVLGQSSGLVGLVDRVEALGGTFTLESPIGCGTMVDIELPLDSELITDGPSF